MASVKQYVAWCERRIGAVVVAEGLQVGLLRVTQGPLTLSFAVRLIRPQPAALRKLMGLGPALAQALQVRSVRVSEGPGAVTIELPLPVEAQRTPTAGELARHTSGLCVAVGLDAMRRPVAVDLRQHGALLWSGPSRRGKTQSMKSTLYALAAKNGGKVAFVILSQKRADWSAFEPAFGCLGLVQDPAEALQVLAWAVGRLHRWAKHGPANFALVVVVDDLLNLLAAEAALAAPLGEIASMGAGLGVHLLIGTQEAGSKRGTGGGAVEANASTRVLYRTTSAAAGARSAGQGEAGLEALSGAKGDALLLLDGEGTRIATGLSDDRLIAMLPAGGEEYRFPWRQVAATGHNRSQPPTTGHNRLQPAYNRLQPPTTDLAHPHAIALAEPREGGISQPVVQPIPAQPALFPIAKRPPTTVERFAILEMQQAGQSLSAICRTVYGFKDGVTFEWIKAAVNQTENENYDLSTEDGRTAVQALLASGEVNWKETVKELERRRLS